MATTTTFKLPSWAAGGTLVDNIPGVAFKLGTSYYDTTGKIVLDERSGGQVYNYATGKVVPLTSIQSDTAVAPIAPSTTAPTVTPVTMYDPYSGKTYTTNYQTTDPYAQGYISAADLANKQQAAAASQAAYQANQAQTQQQAAATAAAQQAAAQQAAQQAAAQQAQAQADAAFRAQQQAAATAAAQQQAQQDAAQAAAAAADQAARQQAADLYNQQVAQQQAADAAARANQLAAQQATQQNYSQQDVAMAQQVAQQQAAQQATQQAQQQSYRDIALANGGTVINGVAYVPNPDPASNIGVQINGQDMVNISDPYQAGFVGYGNYQAGADIAAQRNAAYARSAAAGADLDFGRVVTGLAALAAVAVGAGYLASAATAGGTVTGAGAVLGETEASMAAADAMQLAAQGIGKEQIATTIAQSYSVDAATAATMADLATTTVAETGVTSEALTSQGVSSSAIQSGASDIPELIANAPTTPVIPETAIPTVDAAGNAGFYDTATGQTLDAAGNVIAEAPVVPDVPGTQLAEATQTAGQGQVVSDVPYRVDIAGAAGTAEAPTYAITESMTPGSQLATQAQIDAGTATWNAAANAWEVPVASTPLAPVVSAEIGAGTGAGAYGVGGANYVYPVVIGAEEAAIAASGLTAAQVAALGGTAAAAAAIGTLGSSGAATAANQTIASSATAPVAPAPTPAPVEVGGPIAPSTAPVTTTPITTPVVEPVTTPPVVEPAPVTPTPVTTPPVVEPAPVTPTPVTTPPVVEPAPVTPTPVTPTPVTTPPVVEPAPVTPTPVTTPPVVEPAPVTPTPVTTPPVVEPTPAPYTGPGIGEIPNPAEVPVVDLSKPALPMGPSPYDWVAPAAIGAGAGILAGSILTPEPIKPKTYEPIGPVAFGTATPPVNPGMNPGYLTAPGAIRPQYAGTPTQANYFWGQRPLIQTAADIDQFNTAVPQTNPFAGAAYAQGVGPNRLDINQFIRQYLTPEQYYALTGSSAQYPQTPAEGTSYVGGPVAPGK